jgi:hypothetical protein
MVSVGDFDRFIFIVGAPRCGTTTLSRFLKDHPSIRFPAIKEPHFFAQNDLRGLSDKELKKRVERDYLQPFFGADSDRRIGADGSVTYLYAPEQLEPILRLWPDSRFVVSVRDPLKMLPSLHRRLIYVGEETVADFADAWAAAPDRAEGRKLPRQCQDPRLFRYDEAARFGTYLERLYSVVGRERCQVVVFDDLASDPAGEYRQFMEFAGLEPQADVDFSPRRAGESVRFRWLQRVLKRPPRAVRGRLTDEYLRHRARKHDDPPPEGTVGVILSLRRRVLKWNSLKRPAEPIPTHLQIEIRDRFKDEVEHLGKLLNRDLSHWLQVKPSPSPGSKDTHHPTKEYRRAFSH